MKKLTIFSVIVAIVFSAGVLAAGANPVSPPNSHAFGKSLDAWMGSYFLQWLTLPAVVGEKNVTFLPISCGESATACTCEETETGFACTFDMTVAPGTALALPFISYLGFSSDDVLPDECWGGTCSDPSGVTSIFAEATLDRQPIAEPSAAYYVGPSPIEPPIQCTPVEKCYVYQAIGVVIKPLRPGDHQLVLYSGFRGEGWAFTYNNTWNITVLPPGKK